MYGKIARWAFLLLLAVMVVSYAIQAGHSNPVEPQGDAPIGRMYS
ncbi:MAG: hypothetical protein ABI830_04555 [Pseudolabrys sp.]